MPDYTWNQGRVDSSTGVVDFTNTSGIVTSLIRLPLGSYEFVLPYVAVQFRKVTNGSESDVSYSNIKRYIYLYDEQGSFIARYQITNERYLFENANWYNAKSFRFECYYSGNTLMYPEVQQETLGTYYYKVLCSFYFNVVEFHKDDDIWISDDSVPFSNIEVTTPIPDSYWRIDSNSSYPYHENLKTIQNIPEPSIPASYWRIDRYHNGGYSWHERLLDISYNPPSDNPVYKTPTLYELYADSRLVWSSNNIDPDYGIISPTLTIEDSNVKQLQFKIPPNNLFYNRFERLKTKIKVFRNKKELFEGRIISETLDFQDNRDVLVEGNLGYFNDTRQPQKEYSYYTALQILEAILTVHNDKVDSSRKFVDKNGNPNFILSCTKEFPREDNYWYTQFETTLNAITNLAEALECHVNTDVDPDGYRRLVLFEEITDVSNQKIIFGNNLEDFTRSYDMGELATVLLPLGKHKSNDNDAGDEMIPGKEDAEEREEDNYNTVAWRKWGYKWDSFEPYERRCLRLNKDVEDDSDVETYGERAIVCEPGSGASIPHALWVRWVTKVKEGDVFYLESTLPGKQQCDMTLYFYTIRSSEGYQLDSKTNGDTAEYHFAPKKNPDGTKTNDTRIKIEIPAGGTTLIIGGCTQLVVDGDTYPFKLYEQRKLPDEMDDYITVEKAQVPVDPLQPEGTKKDYDSLYIQAVARDVETVDQLGHTITVHVDPMQEWGYIEKVIEFDDIEDPTDLYNKAVQYLEEYQYDKLQLELTAMDGVVLGVDFDYIQTYQLVRCISPRHGMDRLFPVNKTILYLDQPSSNKYELNTQNDYSLTQTNSSINSELFNKINQAGSRSATLELAKKNAYRMITSNDQGVFNFNRDENGNIISITIATGDGDWRNATKFWIWNYAGLGFLDSGQSQAVTAITNDGKIIANSLAANSAILSSTLTGELTVGAVNDGESGVINVLGTDSDHNLWSAVKIESDVLSTDGYSGRITTNSKPRGVDGLHYYTELINGVQYFGYQYLEDGEIQGKTNTMKFSSQAWGTGEGGSEERPTIDAYGNFDIHATDELRLYCQSLYFDVDDDIYVGTSGDNWETGGTDDVTVGNETLHFVKGIYVGKTSSNQGE